MIHWAAFVRLLRAKYFPNGNLQDNVFTSDYLAMWKGIEHGVELVKKMNYYLESGEWFFGQDIEGPLDSSWDFLQASQSQM